MTDGGRFQGTKLKAHRWKGTMGMNISGEMCMPPERLIWGAGTIQSLEMLDAMCPRFRETEKGRV